MTEHLETWHPQRITVKEPAGMTTALRRTENLRKAGVRVVSTERIANHFFELKEEMTAPAFARVWLAVRRALCEAMVVIGQEDEYSPRGYRDLKRDVRKLLW